MSSNSLNLDSSFWRIFNSMADFIILNVLFILCCLPVVTIGASVTALYTLTLKFVKKEDFSVSKDFFSAFKNNFKQSTIIWLIMLAVGIFLLWDLYIFGSVPSGILKGMYYLFIFSAFLYLMVLSFVFPIQSQFISRIPTTFKNSFLFGFGYFIPWTILIILVNLAPFILLLVLPASFYILVPIAVVFGFASLAYLNSIMFNRMFKKYIDRLKKGNNITKKER